MHPAQFGILFLQHVLPILTYGVIQVIQAVLELQTEQNGMS